MPIGYDAPIGPTLSGAPLPSNSLNGTLVGNSLTGIPSLTATGGAAGPATSGIGGNVKFGNVIINTGDGNRFLWAFAAILGGVYLWKKFRQK